MLLVGNHHQLKPLVFSRKEQNPFTEQLQISLFSRLIWNGLPAVKLLEQHRVHTQLCDFVSQVFYDGELRTPDTLDEYVIDVNRRFVKHNSRSKTFRTGGALMWVDVKDSQAQPDSRQISTTNVKKAASTVAIIQRTLSNSTIRLDELVELQVRLED